MPEVCTEGIIAETRISADFNPLLIDGGVSFQNQRVDTTGRVLYMPSIHRRTQFDIGVGFSHHYLRYYETFSENDLMFSIRLHWFKNDFHDVEIAPGLMWKFANIFAVQNQTTDDSSIFNYSFLLEYRSNWHFTEALKMYFYFGSFDYFDYPLFGTAFFKGGFAYQLSDELGFDTSITFKFIDMIVSAVMLNQCSLRTSVRVDF